MIPIILIGTAAVLAATITVVGQFSLPAGVLIGLTFAAAAGIIAAIWDSR